MTRILVINGNPDPAVERLTSALATAYAEGAQGAGHTVSRVDVGGLDFPLLRTAKEFVTEPDDPDIVAARGALLLAEHLVFIYPLWLGGPPALLKGFMEQIARAEFALGSRNGLPHGKLKGRSARVVVTMGMPAPFYRLFYGAHGVRAFNRGILGISGIKPVRTSYLGGVGSPAHCVRLVEALRRMGRLGA